MQHRLFISVSILFVLLTGCTAIKKQIPFAESNEKLFADGMIAAHQERYDEANEFFMQIEGSHPLYPIAKKELDKIRKKTRIPSVKKPKIKKKFVKKASDQELEKYQKYLDDAKIYMDKGKNDFAYLSFHLAECEVAKDKKLAGKANAGKQKIKTKALAAVRTKVHTARILDRKHEYQEVINMLRPIAEMPLMEKAIKNTLASALHKLALLNYQKSRYEIAADLFEEEYKCKPSEAAKNLSEKARKLSEALKSN